LDEITDAFLPLIQFMANDTDSIDDLVALLKASDQTDMLQRLSLSRKRVMMVSRLMNNKPELIKLVINRMKTKSENILMYLEDIYDHAIIMKQDLQQFDVSLTRAHSNYLAQISIEINNISNKGNRLAIKLTVLASLFLPMQVITGLWGMNVKLPGQENENYASFILIVSTMMLLSLGTLLVFQKIMNNKK
jgi:magnesium transporter